MAITKKELLDCISQFKDLKALVVGDLMLDRYIFGSANRVSDEAPVPIVHINKTEDRLGGAGNVVNNLINLGVKVTAVGIIGDDQEGQVIKDLLTNGGVNTKGIFTSKNRPTILKTRVLARSQQIVRIDREQKREISLPLQEQVEKYILSEIDNVDLIIVSDYGQGVISKNFLQLISDWKNKKITSLEKCPLIIDPNPANSSFYSGATIMKPNKKEAEVATGIKINNREDAREVASLLRKNWNTDVVLLSLSEDGLLISDDTTDLFMPTLARAVFDVSGAGDTVTAVFSSAIACKVDFKTAGYLANLGAGVVVSEVGTSTISTSKLINEIERMTTKV